MNANKHDIRRDIDLEKDCLFPHYTVRVCHPATGWQTVNACYTRGAAIDIMWQWVRWTKGKLAVCAMETSSDVGQCWDCVDRFDPK